MAEIKINIRLKLVNTQTLVMMSTRAQRGEIFSPAHARTYTQPHWADDKESESFPHWSVMSKVMC